MVRVLFMYVLPIALVIYSIVDISQTDESNIKILPKWAWLLIALFTVPIGPIAWLIAGKDRRRRPPKGKNTGGPKGPDDDPDFLRGL